MEAIWEALVIWVAGDLGVFISIQVGNKAILEPKVRPLQVTAKPSQVKPSQCQIEVPNVDELWYVKKKQPEDKTREYQR